ncbi:MAG: hypothetical protein RI996_202 [Candidatus Parcubacteria bacterium]|jgi:peptidoglycan hydrolase-like protein with peptidoglycan-binding domain
MKKCIALSILLSVATITSVSAMTSMTETTTVQNTDNMIANKTMMSITKDAGVGSRGTHVMEIQNFLISGGFLSTSATGYFGPATKKAVMAYQKSVGVTATGYFGAKTRAKMSGSMDITDGPMMIHKMIQ